MRILVIRFSSLGDVVLATAAVHGLHARYPDAEIVMATKSEYLPVFEHFPPWLKVVPLEPDQSESSYRKLVGERPYEMAVDLHGSLRSRHLMMIIMSQSKCTVDKQTFRRFRMVWSKNGLDRPISTVEAYLRAAEIDTKALPQLLLSDSECALVAEEIRGTSNLIGIGWGAKHPTKAVPESTWSDLINAVSRHIAPRVAVFGLSSDRAAIEKFIAHQNAGHNFQAMTGLPLRDTMIQIAACRAFVTSDSGLMHVADALGVPTFGLFGPTHPSLGFAPAGEKSKAFHAGIWCSPCHRHGSAPCFRERRFCFDDLDVEAIAASVIACLRDPEAVSQAQ